jgi:hypothetical protein
LINNKDLDVEGILTFLNKFEKFSLLNTALPLPFAGRIFLAMAFDHNMKWVSEDIYYASVLFIKRELEALNSVMDGDIAAAEIVPTFSQEASIKKESSKRGKLFCSFKPLDQAAKEAREYISEEDIFSLYEGTLNYAKIHKILSLVAKQVLAVYKDSKGKTTATKQSLRGKNGEESEEYSDDEEYNEDKYLFASFRKDLSKEKSLIEKKAYKIGENFCRSETFNNCSEEDFSNVATIVKPLLECKCKKNVNRIAMGVKRSASKSKDITFINVYNAAIYLKENGATPEDVVCKVVDYILDFDTREETLLLSLKQQLNSKPKEEETGVVLWGEKTNNFNDMDDFNDGNRGKEKRKREEKVEDKIFEKI